MVSSDETRRPDVDEAEQAAVRRCQHGDPAGLAALVALHQERAMRVAALITRDPHLAEDIVADAFLTAFRRSKSFQLGRPFGPWFLRVVANTALKTLAARRRDVPLPPPDADVAFAWSWPGDARQQADADPNVWVARLEDRAAIRAALATLPAKQRAAVVLKYFAELDEAEIARALTIPRGTVKSRLFHGLARLRLKLAELRPV